MYLTSKDKRFIGGLIFALTAVSLTLWYLFGEIALVFLIVGSTATAIAVQFEIYRQTAVKLVHLRGISETQLQAQTLNYKEIESLVQVISLLKLNAPLPPM